jgi:hypothetical protein
VSSDDATHGRKLYSLFARDREEYVSMTPLSTNAVGQIVVKQSWMPELVVNPDELAELRAGRRKAIETRLSYIDPTDKTPRFTTELFDPYVQTHNQYFKASNRRSSIQWD